MQNETLSPDWLEPLETRVCYVCLCRPSGTITSPAKCLTLVNPIRFGYVVGWPPFQSFSRYGAGSQGTLNTSNLPNHLWRQIIIALNGMVPFFRYLNLGPRARVLPLDSTPPSARARTHNIHNMCSITPIFTCVFGCICPWHTPIVSVHETYIHTYLHTYIQTYIHTCSVFSKGFCQQIQICCRIPLWEDEGKACCRKRTAYDSPMAIYLANI